MTLIWSQQGQNKLPHHQTVCCTFPLSATKNLFERVDIWKLYVVNFLFKSFGQDIIRLKDITVDIYQFGFLQGRSTTTQLLSTIHDFAKSRNSSFATDVIFLDLAKAFDSVPHERLLIKLRSLGIVGNLINWLRHFLTCRM